MGIWDEGIPVTGKSGNIWDEGLPIVRSAVEGHTGGLSEPIISALKAMASIPYPSGAGDDQGLMDNQMRAMQEDIQARKSWKEANPLKDLGAQLGGAMIPSPVNIPSKVFAAAKNAPRALGVLKGVQSLPKSARKMPLKMAESVAGGLGMEGIRQAAQKPTGFLEGHNTAEDLATTGAVSAAIPVAGTALKKSWDAMKWTGKAMFHSLFGVTEENVKKYMKMPLEIESTAPELADIKQRVDQAVSSLSKDFESAKVSTEEAKEAFQSFKVNLTNALNEQLHNAKEAAALAKEMLADAYAKTIDKLKSVPKPDYMAPQVMEAAETLKKQVLQASLDAMKHLPENAYTTKAKIIPFIDEQIASVAPFGDKNSQAIASLQKLKAQIENYAGDASSSVSKATALSRPSNEEKRLSAHTIKKMIQSLQRDIAMPKGPAEFPDAARANKYAITGKINGLLKSAFPEYAEAMIPTARKTEVLKNFNDKFKTEQGTAAKLGSNHIKTEAGKHDLKILENLETETETSLLPAVKKWLEAQGFLEAEKNTGAIKKSLPEYAADIKARKDVLNKGGYLKKKNFDSQVANSKEKSALDAATKRLDEAKGKAKIVDGMKESQTSGIISGVTAGKNREWNIKRLKELGDAVGQDFVKEIQDRHVLDSFKKNATRGSRNIVQGGLLGLFAMSSHSLTAMLGGALGGGVMGRAFLDEYGPDMGKRLIYTVKWIKEHPKLETIQNSKLPEELKKSLEIAYKYWMVKEAEKEGVVFDRDKAPSKTDGKSASLRLKALGG